MKKTIAAAALVALITQSAALPAHAFINGAAQTTRAKAPPPGDPYQWLEDKDGARSMAWVKAQNARSLPILERDPHYATLYAQALKINQSAARIPTPTFMAGSVYNYWQDATHVRGIWRRTTPQSYRSASPQWSTVLDLDALAKSENANWVFEGYDCAEPAETDCLVHLSDGGEDAQTLREFDLKAGQFVKDGFVLSREKQNVAWEDGDTLLVARAWEPGELTASGYAYDVRRLKRGQALADAQEVFKGEKSDISVDPFTIEDGQGNKAVMLRRGVTFFTSKYYFVTPSGLKQLAIPEKAGIAGLVHGRLLVTLAQDWAIGGKTFAQGSLVSMDLAKTVDDPAHPQPVLVFHPGSRESLGGTSTTKNDLVLTVYQNVRARAFVYAPTGTASWSVRRLALPDNDSIDVTDTSIKTDDMFLEVRGFLTPTTLYAGSAAAGTPQKIKALPAMFDASKDVVEQHEATSKDGTKIPYFIVHPKNMVLNGANPTVISAYGGFQISETPTYNGIMGKLWLERGGVYVLANIRGGGEFGPAWHEAGLKTHRQRIYDDFYAVAKDLVDRKVTTPRHLGIAGGSNGGLLMGVEFTQHPEMYNAVQIEVPLLDMLRFEKIQAGASWVGEYGSVTVPAERAFLAKISPYNNLRGGVAYPEPFIWTTTKDDRVGPQHARKFAAKLQAMGVPYLYYEVTEGGHGAGANLKESAKTAALGYTYFMMKLM